MRVLPLFMTGIVVLSFTAEKCRQLVGEESSSKSWTERFAFLNCFDMSYGTMACLIKECVKLYLYCIRAVHVHKVRDEATKAAVREVLSRGDQSFEEAVNRASQVGNAAAKQASRQVKHIMGPIVSSGWDIFETLYVGGTLWEGIIRGIGTFFGAYSGGIIGEGKLGWVGFLVGSQLGSWVGGRIGLMAYDVGNGVQYLLHLVHKDGSSY
ncbi:hypothetical protein RJ639_033556 [Escallonia herrerae]|uniref:Uncharacterized protein n=1 Tax=Escallonia herrerae TaxID=1293975 RepID=A0AA88WV27_9ASTE|nr:hypothetical protein RJ639_033556 [Escallonia herrerae]